VVTAQSGAGQRSRTTQRHEEWSVPQITAYLNDAVGPKLVAHMLGKNPQTVARWAAGTQSPPQPKVESRLRGIFQIVQMLVEVDSRHVVRAWLLGMNPQLEDRAPAEVIAEGDIRQAMVAARAFISGG
jgi:hypothetical protein